MEMLVFFPFVQKDADMIQSPFEIAIAALELPWQLLSLSGGSCGRQFMGFGDALTCLITELFVPIVICGEI